VDDVCAAIAKYVQDTLGVAFAIVLYALFLLNISRSSDSVDRAAHTF